MASLFSKALVYLGLVDEDRLEGNASDLGLEHHPGPAPPVRPEPEGRRIEPPASASRTSARPEITSRFGDTAVGQQAAVRPLRPEPRADVIVVEEFGDARILADRVRDRTPIILDFRRCDSDLVRRVIDFSSGLIYALDGTMTKVGENLVLVLPPHTNLSDDEKRRLAGLGVYDVD